jgi:hypothetical protein
MKPSFWQEWRPPQVNLLHAPGRARLGVFGWSLMAICHTWDERQAGLAAERKRQLGKRIVRILPDGTRRNCYAD